MPFTYFGRFRLKFSLVCPDGCLARESVRWRERECYWHNQKRKVHNSNGTSSSHRLADIGRFIEHTDALFVIFFYKLQSRLSFTYFTIFFFFFFLLVDCLKQTETSVLQNFSFFILHFISYYMYIPSIYLAHVSCCVRLQHCFSKRRKEMGNMNIQTFHNLHPIDPIEQRRMFVWSSTLGNKDNSI